MSRRAFSTRTVLTGLLLALSLLMGAARADHGPRPSRLGGSVLCLDAASAHAVVHSARAREGALEAALEAQALAELHAVFERLEVAFETRASCEGAPAYTQLRLLAQALDPEVYLNFPDESSSTTVLLQVAAFSEIAVADAEAFAQDPLHVLFSNELHSEEEMGVSVSEHLRAVGDAQIRALARAWWDDNAEAYARAQRSLLPPLLGGLAALTLLLGGWQLRTRLRRPSSGSS